MDVYLGAAKSAKVEAFKNGIARTLQAMKFDKFDKEE